MTDLDELERRAWAARDSRLRLDLGVGTFNDFEALGAMSHENSVAQILTLISEIREARKMKQENG